MPDTKKSYREPISPLSDKTKPRFLSGTHGAAMTEEKLNLSVGLKLRDAIEALGAEAVMTREQGRKCCVKEGNPTVKKRWISRV